MMVMIFGKGWSSVTTMVIMRWTWLADISNSMLVILNIGDDKSKGYHYDGDGGEEKALQLHLSQK